MPPRTTQRTKVSMSFPKWRRRCRSASERRRNANLLIGKHATAICCAGFAMANSVPGSSGCGAFSACRGFHSSSRGSSSNSGYYDDPPLPSLLVAFKEHDAITACFDEEGQSMMEGTAEPTVCVVFSPRQPEQVRHAIRIVDRFIALELRTYFELIEEIQERMHAGTSVDRGEPSLRAA
jgi:hypothetical protein